MATPDNTSTAQPSPSSPSKTTLSPIPRIYCEGTPHSIGLAHGRQAAQQIQGSIEFYTQKFRTECSLSWPDACRTAVKWLPFLESQPMGKRYVDEMRGVAEGAGVAFESILALNVRTEIAFGLFDDGCTAIAWSSSSPDEPREEEKKVILAQNWDWERAQLPHLIALHIRSDDAAVPEIAMITEAGIIGKIGLNSAGVGVCLNAIKAVGVHEGHLPCHLALRACLESTSVDHAMGTLKAQGVAAACHILLSDSSGASVGVECSARDIVTLEPERGVVVHTNHYLAAHDAEERRFSADSEGRYARALDLVTEVREGGTAPSTRVVEEILDDERGFPTSINRDQTSKSSIATLFSIVMDLSQHEARVRMGRPTEGGEVVLLRPGERKGARL